jgi:hypothetical protein
MIVELAIGALALALLSRGQKTSTSPSGPGPGPYRPPGPKPTPGAPSGPKPTPGGPKPVTPSSPPPGSRIFGVPSGPSSNAIVTGSLAKWGNWIMVAKDCSWVIEGPYLWHLPGREPSGSSSIESSTLESTLAIADGEGRGGNCIMGFIDYLESQDFDEAETAHQIVKEAAPMCAAAGPQFWSPQMRLWYENLRGRIEAWRAGIPFGGTQSVGAPGSLPQCDDVVLHDDELDRFRVATALLREAPLRQLVRELVKIAAPGCDPNNPQMRIHVRGIADAAAWIGLAAFDAAAGQRTAAQLQNGTATINWAALEHTVEGPAATDRVDLQLLFTEGV